MSVTKKYALPLLSDMLGDVAEGAARTDAEASSGKRNPSVDVARARLGGRTGDDGASDVFAPGELVSFERAPGERGPAVVIHAGARDVHVLLDAGRVRRFAPGELARERDAVPAALLDIAGEVRVFGLIAEGQSVRYADPSGILQDGKLVERCRYGGLVLRPDGVVVAVGFRKLWPSKAGDAPS